jgi:hypothetical protein
LTEKTSADLDCILIRGKIFHAVSESRLTASNAPLTEEISIASFSYSG